jgi:hypothetical protein
MTIISQSDPVTLRLLCVSVGLCVWFVPPSRCLFPLSFSLSLSLFGFCTGEHMQYVVNAVEPRAILLCLSSARGSIPSIPIRGFGAGKTLVWPIRTYIRAYRRGTKKHVHSALRWRGGARVVYVLGWGYYDLVTRLRLGSHDAGSF